MTYQPAVIDPHSGKPKMIFTPKCKWCGKRLYKLWMPINSKWYGDREPWQTKINKAGTQWESVDGWWGEFGILGSKSFFCSKSCGYQWAVWKLDEMHK